MEVINMIPISVNSIKFKSLNQAAKRIVEEEYDLNCVRCKKNVMRELRKFVKGRHSDLLYGRYKLSKCI